MQSIGRGVSSMKCLRTEAFPRKIMTIAFTSAMLLQAHNSFAEDEMEGSSLDHAQILHWLSQPENHEGARVTEHSSDESKTRIVIEISNPDKSTSQATPTDAPEPLPYLLPDKDDTNLVSLPVTPLAPPLHHNCGDRFSHQCRGTPCPAGSPALSPHDACRHATRQGCRGG